MFLVVALGELLQVRRGEHEVESHEPLLAGEGVEPRQLALEHVPERAGLQPSSVLPLASLVQGELDPAEVEGDRKVVPAVDDLLPVHMHRGRLPTTRVCRRHTPIFI